MALLSHLMELLMWLIRVLLCIRSINHHPYIINIIIIVPHIYSIYCSCANDNFRMLIILTVAAESWLDLDIRRVAISISELGPAPALFDNDHEFTLLGK